MVSHDYTGLIDEVQMSTGALQPNEFLNPAVLGDLNMDGYMDRLDLGILLGNWKLSVPPSGGELDFRPPVDSEDLGIPSIVRL